MSAEGAGLLYGYDATDRKRITALAVRLVEGKVERGEIPLSEEAIKAAMPQAVRDARQVVNAGNEYLCG